MIRLNQRRNKQATIAQVTETYQPGAIALQLQPIIEEALVICKKDKFRQGTILNPILVVWFVIMTGVAAGFKLSSHPELDDIRIEMGRVPAPEELGSRWCNDSCEKKSRVNNFSDYIE